MSDYFEKLRVEGQKLDEGINKLTEIWNAPHIHIGRSYARYTENSENLEDAGKAKAAAEALSKFVAELKVRNNRTVNIFQHMIRALVFWHIPNIFNQI